MEWNIAKSQKAGSDVGLQEIRNAVRLNSKQSSCPYSQGKALDLMLKVTEAMQGF